jgi:hypothetical protein
MHFYCLFTSQVMKEMFIQTFGVPSGHRAAKPFHDHVISFFYLDGRVWLRHYQVPTPSPRDLLLSRHSVFVGVGCEPLHEGKEYFLLIKSLLCLATVGTPCSHIMNQGG